MKKDSDILMKNDIRNDLGYTGDGDKSSKRKKILSIYLPKKMLKLNIELLTKKYLMICKVNG